MKKRLLAAGAVGISVLTAASIYAAAQMPASKAINLGPGPVTEEQIRDRLTAAGYSNIQIAPRRIFAVAVTRNGRAVELAIDPASGNVIRAGGDNDGDDDD